MLRKLGQGCAISFIALTLLACGDSDNYAPVTEINTIDPIPRAGVHRVTRQESVYEIAWRYGLDYRQLVARNHLKSPYILRKGQVISLGVVNANSVVSAAPVKAPANLESTSTTFIRVTPTVIPAQAGTHPKHTTAVHREMDSRLRRRQYVAKSSYADSSSARTANLLYLLASL